MQPPCHSPQLARPVQASLWNDAEFVRLSHKSRLLYVYLLTHPQLTSLGALRGKLAWFGQELGLRPAEARKAADELRKAQLVDEHDADCCVAICDYLWHSPPDDPEIADRWYADYQTLPDGPGRVLALQRARVVARDLGGRFAREFARVFGISCDDPPIYAPLDPEPPHQELRQRWTADWYQAVWKAQCEREHPPARAARATDAESTPAAASPPAEPAESRRFGCAPHAENANRSRQAPAEGQCGAATNQTDEPGPPPRGKDGRFVRRAETMPSAARVIRTPQTPRAVLVHCVVSAIANPLPAGIRTGGSAAKFLQDVQHLPQGPQRADNPYRFVRFQLKVEPYNPDP